MDIIKLYYYLENDEKINIHYCYHLYTDINDAIIKWHLKVELS